MTYTIHNLVQGSAEWKAHRAGCHNASELVLAMGYTMNGLNRTDLIRKLATGIEPEITPFQQKLFDDGHRFEALASPIAEKIIGRDLYPITASIEVDGLARRLSASLDGATDDDSINFEHKSLNAELAAALDKGIIPEEYWPQMEQGMLINRAGRTLFMASKWDENDNLIEEKHCWYESRPELRAKIVPTWRQIEEDAASYQHVEIAERPKADVVVDLPALFVHAKGKITTHNMDEFSKALALRLAETRAIVLITDQDFSNAKESAKKFRETAKAIALSKEQMLAQTETIGEAARKMDTWAKDLNATALQLEKDVEREDKAKKEVMVMVGKNAYAEHIAALEAEIAPIRLNLTAPIFAEALKNKRNYASMQDAVDTMLAGAKVAADSAAKDVRAKLAWCKENAAGHSALFPDLQQIITKPMEDFALTITSRIEKAKADEAAKLEAERARIRAEEEEKAVAKVKAEQDEADRQQAKAKADAPEEPVAPTLSLALHASAPQAPNTPAEAPNIAQVAPSIDDGSRIKLGDINLRLSPLAVTADMLAALGFQPAGKEGAAKLYRQADFQSICAAIVRHVQTAALNHQLRKAA